MATMNVKDAAGSTVAVEKPLAPGQALMAASRPVAIASDQSAVPVTPAGNVAHDGVDSGNPIKIGGKAESTSPTAVADGDRVDGWFDTRGALAIFSVDSSGNRIDPAAAVTVSQTDTTAYIDVTLSLDTSAYATGDVLADTQAVAGAVTANAGGGRLESIVVIDEDDQGVAFDLVFLSANNSLGTENAAVSITDANARDILGIIPIAAADFVDLGGVRVATKTAVGLQIRGVTGGTSIYVGAIARGTATYTASGIRLRLGIIKAA